MQEISFNTMNELTDFTQELNAEEMAQYKEKLLEISKLFDRPGQRVIGELPPALKLKEVVGICHNSDKTTKITFNRFQTLYLCWVPTSETVKYLKGLQEQIKARNEWDERWEPWELYGQQKALKSHKGIIECRLKNEEERQEFNDSPFF